MGLESLAPAYRTQYDALVPEIERATRSASNARGMFYSGDAIDAESRAKADLLAKLAGESAASSASAEENAKNRALESSMKAEDIKAQKRNALLGMLGTGVGSGATLLALSSMNKGGANLGNNVIYGGPDSKTPFFLKPDGTATPIDLSGKAAVGGSSFNMMQPGGMTPGAPFSPEAVTGTPSWNMAAPGGMAGAAVAAPSMWKQAVSLPNLGAGALGGGLGYLGARAVNGGGSTAGDIGSALGGAGGYAGGAAMAPMLAAKFGMTSPWAMGLGALAGSFGGGLLGNLFK